ncbi:Ficolin-1 [Bulinus truncatus]|nr:Ficolin-1 [Bulinus truncatus]
MVVVTVILDDTTHVNFASQCPSRQNQCLDINSDKDRVVTLLDDGLQVMCDAKTDGGGWIIFQRRINGNVSFYRGWEEYKYGFGDYDAGEFYLGNEYVYKLTSHEQYELRVELSFQGKLYYAMYSTFIIQDENNSYTHVVSGYSGSAPDNLAYHNQIKCTTFDKDNDNNNDNNCAELFAGAWWYKDCHDSNLNGFCIWYRCDLAWCYGIFA